MARFFSARPDGSVSPAAVWVALATVYVVWGSTYLGIRVVDETMPPMLAGAARFFVAGSLLLGWLVARNGMKILSVGWRGLLSATIVGTALLVGGNGVVMVAEQHIASGLAALLVASEPIWIVALRMITRERVSMLTILGLVVGLTGVAVLVLPGSGSSHAELAGIAMVLGAAVSWAIGSFVSPKLALPSHPLVSAGLQMVLASAVMAIVGFARGEAGQISPDSFSTSSVLALVYLVVFGSIVAFTAYAWLLQNAPISKVSTYAYVNPTIAIFLGWALLGEAITTTILAGAAIIVASVAVIVREEGKSKPISDEESGPHAPAPAVDAYEDSPAA